MVTQWKPCKSLKIGHTDWPERTSPNGLAGSDTKQYLRGSRNAGALGITDYPFIVPPLTQVQSDPELKHPKGFYLGSNRTAWYLNCEQTNDLRWIDLYEIKLFDHLTVSKQRTDV